MSQDVLVMHNAVGDLDDPSTRDVLDQVATVCEALDTLGLPHTTLAVSDGDLAHAVAQLAPATVFNLVESPPGHPRFQVEAAAALEAAGVVFTGSPAAVIERTTDKLTTRADLAAAGLTVAAGGALDPEHPDLLDTVPPPWILKPAREDASLGLDGDLLCTDRQRALERARLLRRRFPSSPVLVEHFLPGREFNVSLLGTSSGVVTLPVAELEYLDFPEDMPRILGFEAKWNHDSFAYVHTVRRFLTAAESARAAHLAELATRCWKVTGVRGYARVDLRLDENGTPCVLEINANPCLSADAGFVAAAVRAGMSSADLVGSILAAAETETA